MTGLIGKVARGFASLLATRSSLRSKSTPDPTTTGGWSALSGPYSGWTDANEIWKRRTGTELETIHNTMAVVYACVKRICMAAQEAPPAMGRKTPDGWIDDTTHPLNALLCSPNPQMSYSDFLWHLVAHLQCAGDSYVWKWRGTNGPRASRPLGISELWPIPTSWVQRQIADASGRVVGYTLWQGSNKPPINVLAEDMLRIRFPDPSDLSKGLGPLQAALRETQLEEERQDYQMEMLSNIKPPGIIWTQADGWDDEQKEEFRAVIDSGLRRGKRGKSVFLSGDGAKFDMPAPLADLDWPSLTSLGETRICACFGVPAIIVGLRAGLERSTFANYGEARRSFYQDTMVALWSKLDGDLTRGLLLDEGEKNEALEVYHDTTDVKGLQEDSTQMAQRATTLFNGSLITRNEARELAGMEKLDGPQGDVFVVPMSMTEVPLGSAGVPPAPEVPPKDAGSANQE